MRVAYLAGPYRAATENGVYKNIQAAREIAIELWKMGFACICPHTNTAMFGGACPDEVWLLGDLNIISRLDPESGDCVVMMPTWESSRGAKDERKHAINKGLTVYHWPDMTTEVK